MTGEPCEVGILFGDIAGSTRLYERLGDRMALDAIDGTLGVLAAVVAECGGTVVKTIGDELMAAFPDPVAVFEAAMEMQRRLDLAAPLATPGGDLRIAVKIGFHFGAAIRADNDFFGDTVNVAARMVGLAKGGQIITTAEIAPRLLPLQRSSTRSLDCVEVRGKAEAIEIVEVIWQQTPDLTMLPAALMFRGPDKRRDELRITYAGRDWQFAPEDAQITIGREAGNHLIVSDNRASRRHATIERRRQNWVLIDHSTNGTFVSIEGGQEIELRRQEIILHGRGRIDLGGRHGGAAGETLAYAVERG